MSATAQITSVCEIAEAFGKEIGLAEFEIERVVRTRLNGKVEWLLSLRIDDGDTSLEDDAVAVVIVDAETHAPRLLEGL